MKFFNQKLFTKIILILFLIILLSPQTASAGFLGSLSDFLDRTMREGTENYEYQAQSGTDKVKTGLEATATNAGVTAAQRSDLPIILGRVINYSFGLLGIITLTVTLVGGLLWMTAGGNEEKVGKAKGFIINGINGLIVIFLAYALVYVVLSALNTTPG